MPIDLASCVSSYSKITEYTSGIDCFVSFWAIPYVSSSKNSSRVEIWRDLKRQRICLSMPIQYNITDTMSPQECSCMFKYIWEVCEDKFKSKADAKTHV